MDKSLKIFIGVCIVAIIGLAVWGVAYNNGTLIVKSNLDSFTVNIEGKLTTCQKVCELKLAPKGYDVELSQQNYTGLTTKIYLLRGETEELEYNPIKIPQFELIEEETSTEQQLIFENAENGQQNVTFNDKLITIFRDPIPEPNSVLSTDLKKAFILSEQNLTSYYIVDLKDGSKEKIEISPTELEFAKPVKFKLLSSDRLALETDAEVPKVYIYNYVNETYLQFPVSKIEHIAEIESGTLLILSSQILENSDTLGVQSIARIVDLADKDQAEISRQLQVEPTKLYKYNISTGEFTYLRELDKKFQPPYSFASSREDDKTINLFKANDQIYQIQ